MVNHAKKLVFIHVPRTGGQTVKAAFGPDEEWDWGVTHYAYEHQRKLLTESKYGLCLDYVHFTCVRNPWDKMVSIWEHRRYHKEAEGGIRGLDFEDWVRWVYDEGREGYKTDRCHNEGDVEYALGSCLRWIRQSSGDFPLHSLGSEHGEDAWYPHFLCLRFERLEEQVRALAELAGLKVAEPFPKKNASLERLHADYRDYYEHGDVVELVSNHHLEDITRFGYTLEGSMWGGQ